MPWRHQAYLRKMIPVWLLAYLPRLIAYVALVAVLGGGALWLHHEHANAIERVRQEGRDQVKAAYDKATAAAAAARKKEIDDIVARQSAATAKSEADHAQSLSTLRARFTRERAAVATAGGCRPPASLCPAAGLPAVAASAGRDH